MINYTNIKVRQAN